MALLPVTGRSSQVNPVTADSVIAGNSEVESADTMSNVESVIESTEPKEDGYSVRRSGRIRKPRARSPSPTDASSRSRAVTQAPQRQSNGRFTKSPVPSQQTPPASRATTLKDKPGHSPGHLVTMQHLETHIKPFVDPELFTTYSHCIVMLNCRGPKEPHTRRQYRQELTVLVRENEGLRRLHNEVASAQNSGNEGAHERLLLPVFEEAEAAGVKEKDGVNHVVRSPPPRPQPHAQPQEARVEVRTTATSFDTLPAPTAPYYLAWLQQRAVRFPAAPPVQAECVGIARHFEQPTEAVFDAIVNHYLLETDARHGEWHKLNRQIVLGDDPVFDGDTRYWWEKEGRDLY